jgi:hypothetical protein
MQECIRQGIALARVPHRAALEDPVAGCSNVRFMARISQSAQATDIFSVF